ncbi:MAG TPA: DUF4258 domain-containing protein [Pyrinomonadaceae bacterium]|nr:DUF4258 domain-containing protein [Pyrinomonadaceae bacterium]
MSVLEKIRQLLLDGHYLYTLHIYEKLEEINQLRGLQLTTDDVDETILNGQILDILDNDERGQRYVIEGLACDNNTVLEIVCRIEGNLIIITVYEPYF